MRPFDRNGAYAVGAERLELRKLAVQGAGFSMASSGVGFGVQLIATMVLARVLAPSDFGIFAMVTTFSLLLESVGLNGFTETVLQRDHIDHFLVSNLFWIDASAGVLLTTGFALAGTALARFYHNPHVRYAAVGMSATIFLSGLSVLHLALLKRAMRFAELSVNNVIAQLAYVVVSIVLGLTGWGYWALIAGSVAQRLCTTAGAWILCRWMPTRPRRAPGTASMVRFAMNVYSHYIVNYSAMNLDNLLVGWRFNAESLGFYKKAFDLFFMPANQLLSPIGAVAVSTLSRLTHEQARYRQYFLSGLSVLAFVGMGIGAGLSLVGRDLIRLLLGPGWEETGRIFTLFGPGIGLMLLYGTHGWIHLSLGRADRWFRWGVIELAVTSLLFLLALPWGPSGIAAAWTLSFAILLIPAFWYAGRPIGFGVKTVFGGVWRYLLASLLAGCATAAMLHSLSPLLAAPGWLGAAQRLVVVSLLFSLLYTGSVALLHGGTEPFRRLAGLVQEFAPHGRPFREDNIARATVGIAAPATERAAQSEG